MIYTIAGDVCSKRTSPFVFLNRTDVRSINTPSNEEEATIMDITLVKGIMLALFLLWTGLMSVGV